MPNETASGCTQADGRLSDPAAYYATPEALLNEIALTKEQKVAALRCWAYDAAEINVAVEEGMRNGETGILRRILLALEALGYHVDVERVGPSKQHGLRPIDPGGMYAQATMLSSTRRPAREPRHRATAQRRNLR